MSFIDNDPPKQYGIGELTNGNNATIYSVAKKQGKYKYVVALNMDEIKALVLHGEKYFFTVRTNSKKEYLAALDVQKRAREYIEKSKSETEDNSLVL